MKEIMPEFKMPAGEEETQPRLLALLPFLIFVVFYLGISIWANDFYKVPMPIAFLVASASALVFRHREDFMHKVEVYARGMGDCDIMIMCLIFILAGGFAGVAKATGAVQAAVTIAQALIPAKLMLMGMFLVSCFISISIGTSCGTIAALTPIAASLAASSQINGGLMIGAVVGGAMFGDNLSMISDTTIAATRTQNIAMREKFIANFRIVLLPAVITAITYVIAGKECAVIDAITMSGRDFLLVLPYVLILLLALIGINVMILLFAGIVLAGGIGMALGTLNFAGVLDATGKGALGMSETLIVALLAGGLLKMIRYNGGISYLLKKIEMHIHSVRKCEFGVMTLVAAVNLFTANNTVAIVISGPIAKTLSDKFHCEPRRIASILDATSCFIQGIIPYGAQMLIAVSLAHEGGLKELASFEVISRLYYPWLTLLALIISVCIHRRKDAQEKTVEG